MILWLIVLLCALCAVVSAPALLIGWIVRRALSDADPYER